MRFKSKSKKTVISISTFFFFYNDYISVGKK